MEFVMPLATSDIFGKTFAEDTATKYYVQLSGGLHHMHSMNIYHCDIKEANIKEAVRNSDAGKIPVAPATVGNLNCNDPLNLNPDE